MSARFGKRDDTALGVEGLAEPFPWERLHHAPGPWRGRALPVRIEVPRKGRQVAVSAMTLDDQEPAQHRVGRLGLDGASEPQPIKRERLRPPVGLIDYGVP